VASLPDQPQRICVLVAHPDDEALWFGGSLLQLRDNGAEIIIACATHGRDRVRAAEFKKLCATLDGVGILMDFPDGGGRRKLPDFTHELDQRLADLSMRPAELGLVITHAPHGNERGHSDHIYCYRHARRWAARHGVAFSFASERRLAQLEPALRQDRAPRAVRPSAQWLSGLIQSSIANARDGGVRVSLRHEVRLICDLLPVKAVVANQVDVAAKQRLLEEVYVSQIDGLRQYAAFQSDMEYLYFHQMDAAHAFWRSSWPSS